MNKVPNQTMQLTGEAADGNVRFKNSIEVKLKKINLLIIFLLLSAPVYSYERVHADIQLPMVLSEPDANRFIGTIMDSGFFEYINNKYPKYDPRTIKGQGFSLKYYLFTSAKYVGKKNMFLRLVIGDSTGSIDVNEVLEYGRKYVEIKVKEKYK